MAAITSRIYSQSGIAEQLNVSLTTVRTWLRKGCPHIQKGGQGKAWELDLAAVSKWRETQAAETALGETANLDIDEARRRKLAAEAALTELELNVKKGELIPAELVKETWATMVMSFRAKMLALPSKAAGEVAHLDAAEAHELLTNHVYDALHELATEPATY